MTNGHRIAKILHDDGIRRIAFLPYKREMADSLISVVCACQRLAMTVGVFPVGYTADGEHRLEFPESKEEFNPEEWGAVVYHNPYDDSNMVTEVDERFHSDRMKGKTTLVYIPYYCGYSDIGFKTKPGVRNADYIFCDPVDEVEYQMLYPDKKIIGVESPKMDTIEEGEGDYTLVCTSLIPFLEKRHLKFAEYRWAVFQHEKVIFRPHPLMEETIKALAPNCIDEWRELIRDIEAAGIEIDATDNVGKTFARCKFLITDFSSIVRMWEKTGKPIQIL